MDSAAKSPDNACDVKFSLKFNHSITKEAYRQRAKSTDREQTDREAMISLHVFVAVISSQSEG